MSDFVHWMTGGSLLATVVIWIFNELRKCALTRLTLPDGTPTVDEYVTRPMLALSRHCVQLCARIYSRQEDLHWLLAEPAGNRLRRRQVQVITSAGLDAVCAIVHEHESAVVVWRGTNVANRRQVRANRLVRLVPFDARIQGRVHEGLRDGFLQIRLAVMDALREHVEAGRQIYVTGHSQGGGLASLTCAAMRIRAEATGDPRWLPSGMVTFGSMRAGDDAFSRFVEDACLYHPGRGLYGIQRYRNNNDIVPLVPPLTFGYRHSGRELYIWPAGMVTVHPCTTLKLIQHIKPIAEGVIGDGLADHAITQYQRHILALQIPEAESA